MKKILVLLFLFSFLLTGCDNNDNSIDNQKQNNNYTASRITSTDNTTNTDTTNINIENNNTDVNHIKSIDSINTEIELSSFSTKIYTPDDKARQNNIRITCSKLDGTVVKSR